MSSQAFDRELLHTRERPLSTDLNLAQSQLDRSLRDVLRHLLGGRIAAGNDRLLALNGFLGDGFKVRPESPASGNVVVTAGFGFTVNPATGSSLAVTNPAGATLGGLDDLSLYSPLPLSADVTFAVPTAPAAGFGRKDIIEVKVDRRSENPLTRGIWDVPTEKFVNTLVDKTLAWDLQSRTGTAAGSGIRYKQGVEGAYANDNDFLAAGVIPEPATDAGYIKIATINVRPAAVTFDANVIVDWRPLLFPGGSTSVGLRFSLDTAPAVTISLDHFQAVPGTTPVIYDTTAGAQLGYVAMIAGNANCFRMISVPGYGPSYNAGYLYARKVLADTLTEATIAIQALLAVGTPATSVGVGQLFRRAYFDCDRVQVGVSPALTGTNVYNLNVAYHIILELVRISNP